MADSALTTIASKIDTSVIFAAAHQAVRDEIKRWPLQAATVTYRQLFAAHLREAYRSARSVVASKIIDLKQRRTLIEMKTRLDTQDWAAMHQIDRQIADARVAA